MTTKDKKIRTIIIGVVLSIIGFLTFQYVNSFPQSQYLRGNIPLFFLILFLFSLFVFGIIVTVIGLALPTTIKGKTEHIITKRVCPFVKRTPFCVK